jgi:hypothetical protein
MAPPRDDAERKEGIIEGGYEEDLGKIFHGMILASGPNIILYARQGISDSPMIRGIRVQRTRAITPEHSDAGQTSVTSLHRGRFYELVDEEDSASIYNNSGRLITPAGANSLLIYIRARESSRIRLEGL